MRRPRSIGTSCGGSLARSEVKTSQCFVAVPAPRHPGHPPEALDSGDAELQNPYRATRSGRARRFPARSDAERSVSHAFDEPMRRISLRGKANAEGSHLSPGETHTADRHLAESGGEFVWHPQLDVGLRCHLSSLDSPARQRRNNSLGGTEVRKHASQLVDDVLVYGGIPCLALDNESEGRSRASTS